MPVFDSQEEKSPLASERGVTLIELLFVAAIAVILLGLSAPTMKAAFDGQRLIAAADGISTTLAEARREAIRASRQSTVTINDAARTITFDAFSDAAGTQQARRFIALPEGVDFSGEAVPATVVFDPLGRPTALPVNIPLVSTASGRILTVRVLATGRIEVV